MAIGDWLRRFHDAQHGFTPDPDLPWRMVPGCPLSAREVVVHYDAAPYNTIRRGDGGLERLAAQGDPAFVNLFESGVADKTRLDAAWVGDNEAALSAAVRGGV
jgi:hypothetical protein